MEKLNGKYFRENFLQLKNRVEKLVHFSVDEDTLKQHFIEENASYYAEIEKVTGYEHTETEKHLPADIVDKVNRFPFETKGLYVILRIIKRSVRSMLYIINEHYSGMKWG